MSHVAILSVMDAKITPNIIMAAVTKTGLSPEFHLASLRMGRAGSFCRPPFALVGLFNQSEKSQRSKSRPSSVSVGFVGGSGLSTLFVAIEIVVVYSSDADGEAIRS